MNAPFTPPSPIQIKRHDIVNDVRELAQLTNLPITEAVAKAVRNELKQIRADQQADLERRQAAVSAILKRVDALPRLEPWPTADEFYDEDGLPK